MRCVPHSFKMLARCLHTMVGTRGIAGDKMRRNFSLIAKKGWSQGDLSSSPSFTRLGKSNSLSLGFLLCNRIIIAPNS